MRNLSTPAGGEVDCPQHCLSFRNCLTHCSQWSFPQPGGPHATQPALQRLKGPSTDLQSLVSCSLSFSFPLSSSMLAGILPTNSSHWTQISVSSTQRLGGTAGVWVPPPPCTAAWTDPQADVGAAARLTSPPPLRDDNPMLSVVQWLKTVVSYIYLFFWLLMVIMRRSPRAVHSSWPEQNTRYSCFMISDLWPTSGWLWLEAQVWPCRAADAPTSGLGRQVCSLSSGYSSAQCTFSARSFEVIYLVFWHEFSWTHWCLDDSLGEMALCNQAAEACPCPPSTPSPPCVWPFGHSLMEGTVSTCASRTSKL